MAIRVALNHKTTYQYDRPIMMSPHVIRLRPAPHARTPIHAYSLKVMPERHFLNWQQDPYANYLARLVFPVPSDVLSVEVDLVAEMTVINPFDFFVEADAAKYPFRYEPVLRKELAPYLETIQPGPLLRALVEKLTHRDITTIDYLVEINRNVHELLKYNIRMEPGVQAPEDTLKIKSGSCRDFAWLLVNVLRHLGLAARFVSGYLIQLKADVASLDGPSGAAQDFTDLHAWTEVYLPGAGWIGLDATSGLLTGEGHIPLACTAEPISAAPITGATEKCEVKFDYQMSVRRILEDPRVTKPYTEDQWQEIRALGHQVDERLSKGDVRLTMGGEPTFVSVDDMDGAEWNTTAMGPHKRALAGKLMKRLRKRFADGGFIHSGQGKWYPGESLPRWALACYWRKDGKPIWEHTDLLADEPDAKLGHTDETAKEFISRLIGNLGAGVSEDHVVPGYEDTWYYLWKERRLPVNVDPLKNKLSNAEDRARLAKVFEQGLERVVGYALPLSPLGAAGSGQWQSGAWFFRPERMYLIPGDSPMGFRLPLDSLPWVKQTEYPYVYERDPSENLSPLPEPLRQKHYMRDAEYRTQSDRQEQDAQDPSRMPSAQESASWIVRTALVCEPRLGTLHIFMPPMRYAEDYLDLVSRIEQTASELKTPILIEGYPPPHDSRLSVLKVTPDPGVIEVNVHPVTTWDQTVNVTEGLYEDAHFSRLGTEKFMLDGRHSGTGGGNHIVVGGSVPSDSPFLRRPDLLQSLVSYWHNHPSLSYLFSGMFVGPTSQAPRADEGRPDNIYELEIAMKQVPPAYVGLPPQPWLVDRIFRNLLVDLTGNTHRAEFSIDKLYSPESSSGRLGLVEFRGFEMPPHARMSLAQQLLLRGLIARFWERPYSADLVRWGTQLHDRFMLPHFVMADFGDVLAELRQSGLPFKDEWFAPHAEFRFPHIGTLEVPSTGGLRVDLRTAIEPWYVLGEEPAGGGTVRFVDSSVERMQVEVNGLISGRHVVTANGVAVPLHPTGTNGKYIAGVRYRAWQPASCLHPTIGVHSPLVFDVVDSWSGRSVGGCTYHVSHPGGRAFETFPVNAFEAESRRVARFFKFGHTPGPMLVQQVVQSREFPLTLDLRRI